MKETSLDNLLNFVNSLKVKGKVIPLQVLCGPEQWRTERGGVWGVQIPPPKIQKALQNGAKLNPIVKTVKNC